jgi:hypothetical protein
MYIMYISDRVLSNRRMMSFYNHLSCGAYVVASCDRAVIIIVIIIIIIIIIIMKVAHFAGFTRKLCAVLRCCCPVPVSGS